MERLRRPEPSYCIVSAPFVSLRAVTCWKGRMSAPRRTWSLEVNNNIQRHIMSNLTCCFCLLVFKFCFIVCAFKNLLACHLWQSRIAAVALLPLSGRCQKVRGVSSCVLASTALTHPFHSGLLLFCGNLSCLLVSRESSGAFLYTELLLGSQHEC